MLEDSVRGGLCYLADLVRAIQPVPEGLNMDFLRASSYTGAATTGQDAVVMGLVSKIPIQGRHILLVEDIIDTGKTLQVNPPKRLSVCRRLHSSSTGIPFPPLAGSALTMPAQGPCNHSAYAGRLQ